MKPLFRKDLNRAITRHNDNEKILQTIQRQEQKRVTTQAWMHKSKNPEIRRAAVRQEELQTSEHTKAKLQIYTKRGETLKQIEELKRFRKQKIPALIRLALAKKKARQRLKRIKH